MAVSDKERLTGILQQTLPDARIERRRLDLSPEISLFLISPMNMDRAFSSDEVRSILKRTPYWAFCWGAGHAMAAFLLQNPDICRDRKVLDFGAGSGVAGVAAALSGAREVVACDSDEDALVAARANGRLNGVHVSVCGSLEAMPWQPDVILASDVFYDNGNRPLLAMLPNLAPAVLIADARAKIVQGETYRRFFEMKADTLPDLGEAEDFRDVGFYLAGRMPAGIHGPDD